jgi:hypothetical protein
MNEYAMAIIGVSYGVVNRAGYGAPRFGTAVLGPRERAPDPRIHFTKTSDRSGSSCVRNDLLLQALLA